MVSVLPLNDAQGDFALPAPIDPGVFVTLSKHVREIAPNRGKPAASTVLGESGSAAPERVYGYPVPSRPAPI